MVFKWIQEIIGDLFYYKHTVDNKFLVAFSYIGAKQAASAEATAAAIKQLIYYITTYLNDGIFYCESGMVRAAYYDVRFHNKSKGHIRTGSHFFYLIMTLRPDRMGMSSPFPKLSNLS